MATSNIWRITIISKNSVQPIILSSGQNDINNSSNTLIMSPSSAIISSAGTKRAKKALSQSVHQKICDSCSIQSWFQMIPAIPPSACEGTDLFSDKDFSVEQFWMEYPFGLEG